jgi:hypothetical protein
MNSVWHALLLTIEAATQFLAIGGLILAALYAAHTLADNRSAR